MKYKHAESPGWFYKIDGESKISFNSKGKKGTTGFGYNKEMQAWVEAGGVIEPQYTAEELEQKEIDDSAQALESQKSTVIRLLEESDHKVISHTKHPGDVPAWKTYREALWTIQDSDQIETIPKKPF